MTTLSIAIRRLAASRQGVLSLATKATMSTIPKQSVVDFGCFGDHTEMWVSNIAVDADKAHEFKVKEHEKECPKVAKQSVVDFGCFGDHTEMWVSNIPADAMEAKHFREMESKRRD